ncbi:MAG: YdcF family protein [Alphaproteobacteria bacterium]|nr:YdcF family protein [Alphaproteobacteria bacterium]
MARRLFSRHRTRRRRGWRLLTWPLAAMAGLGLVLLACDWWIDEAAAPFVTDRIDKVPPAEVALVLGTAPYVAGQRRNLYFEYRLDAAAALHKAGKVKYLLVSGDNREREYNEPRAMRDGLIERGVPADAIYRDVAGIRTLDSVLRARDVFAQSRYIVVSQGFHSRRAVWLARAHGIEAFGFDARDVPFEAAPKVWLRQYASAARAVFDVIVGSTASGEGPRVEIGSAPPN